MAAPRVLWRIIDANGNRALEGARAAEEFVRFGLNDARLTARCRRWRHGIGRAVRHLPGALSARLAARDIRADVGRAAPPRRSRDWPALLHDNLQRSAEALRVLEECGRVISLHSAREFQRLRFDAYELAHLLHQRLAAVRHPRRGGARRPRRR